MSSTNSGGAALNPEPNRHFVLRANPANPDEIGSLKLTAERVTVRPGTSSLIFQRAPSEPKQASPNVVDTDTLVRHLPALFNALSAHPGFFRQTSTPQGSATLRITQHLINANAEPLQPVIYAKRNRRNSSRPVIMSEMSSSPRMIPEVIEQPRANMTPPPAVDRAPRRQMSASNSQLTIYLSPSPTLEQNAFRFPVSQAPRLETSGSTVNISRKSSLTKGPSSEINLTHGNASPRLVPNKVTVSQNITLRVDLNRATDEETSSGTKQPSSVNKECDARGTEAARTARTASRRPTSGQVAGLAKSLSESGELGDGGEAVTAKAAGRDSVMSRSLVAPDRDAPALPPRTRAAAPYQRRSSGSRIRQITSDEQRQRRISAEAAKTPLEPPRPAQLSSEQKAYIDKQLTSYNRLRDSMPELIESVQKLRQTIDSHMETLQKNSDWHVYAEMKSLEAVIRDNLYLWSCLHDSQQAVEALERKSTKEPVR